MNRRRAPDQFQRKQRGFGLTAELIITVVIVLMIVGYLSGLVKDYLHQQSIDKAATDFAKIGLAVQKRSAHDGFLFSFWDTNGGRAATDLPIAWTPAELPVFLTDYLVGRLNVSCGNAVNGWNPVNTGGGIDDGDVTAMESTALFSCVAFRDPNSIPFRLNISSVLTPDVTGAMSQYIMYLDTENADFGRRNEPENNILNMQSLRRSLERAMSDSTNGLPSVFFVQPGDLEDTSDDITLSATECENALIANAECDIAVKLEFSGSTNGAFKRKDNQDYMMDDLTFGQSIAAGRQRCAYWTPNGADWVGEMADCGIKGGTNDDDVVLVVDRVTSSGIQITNEADLNHLCAQFEPTNEASGVMSLRPHTASPTTPCGLTRENTIVQLISDRAHVGRLMGQQILANEIYAGQTELYSSTDGQVMLRVYNASHDAVVFGIDNRGNTYLAGDLDVAGSTSIAKNLTVGESANFNMQNSGRVTMGLASDASSLSFSRDNGGRFQIESTGIQLEILNQNTHGIKIESNGANSSIKMSASEGVIAENGTLFHGSKSLLNEAEFNAASGVSTNADKSLSRLVTADYAKYLDDFSSKVQQVGMDRVEGEFLQLQKPNCLHFMDNSNYSSPDANPYKTFMAKTGITAANGKEYARLLLVPTYMKTYNSAFGDNQLFAQHAIHSSADTWDIYLYLSGEGAFSTGAREDGAGGSIAVTICDYSSLDVSKLGF